MGCSNSDFVPLRCGDLLLFLCGLQPSPYRACAWCPSPGDPWSWFIHSGALVSWLIDHYSRGTQADQA